MNSVLPGPKQASMLANAKKLFVLSGPERHMLDAMPPPLVGATIETVQNFKKTSLNHFKRHAAYAPNIRKTSLQQSTSLKTSPVFKV